MPNSSSFKAQRAKYMREWFAKNPEKQAEYYARFKAKETPDQKARRLAQGRERYRRNIDAKKAYFTAWTLRQYGLTTAQFDAMVNARHGRCDICRAVPKRLVVDHDHDTNAIRGLLCSPCNRAIGALGDDIDGLMRAVAYLSKNELLKLVS